MYVTIGILIFDLSRYSFRFLYLHIWKAIHARFLWSVKTFRISTIFISKLIVILSIIFVFKISQSRIFQISVHSLVTITIVIHPRSRCFGQLPLISYTSLVIIITSLISSISASIASKSILIIIFLRLLVFVSERFTFIKELSWFLGISLVLIYYFDCLIFKLHLQVLTMIYFLCFCFHKFLSTLRCLRGRVTKETFEIFIDGGIQTWGHWLGFWFRRLCLILVSCSRIIRSISLIGLRSSTSIISLWHILIYDGKFNNWINYQTITIFYFKTNFNNPNVHVDL